MPILWIIFSHHRKLLLFEADKSPELLSYLRKICMATISNLGIGSAGLGELYNQLDAAERTKLTTITTQQSTYNAQLSAYGKLQSAMTSLQTATAALGKATTWNSTAVSSTNTAFTATTTADASVGSYVVNVNRWQKHRRSRRVRMPPTLSCWAIRPARRVKLRLPSRGQNAFRGERPMAIRRLPGSRARLIKRTATSPPA